ncbi:MAG TPA: hypothetical protein VNL14_15290 [Candidatus Acidoferrales bacterium]|nr:hypothetical protein [Candidatus Acidoferrales bacterium]
MISPADLRKLIEAPQASYWRLSQLAGRLVEVSSFSAPASLSLVFGLVLEAQRQGEPVAWVTSVESFFYPPDAARAGVDLGALVVVRVGDSSAIPRAAEKLVRSSAFSLVALDLGNVDIPVALQTRLAGLARQHRTALICLTEKEEQQPSLGSLVSLRAHASRTRRTENLFTCHLEVLKDKRRGPTWSHTAIFSWP